MGEGMGIRLGDGFLTGVMEEEEEETSPEEEELNWESRVVVVVECGLANLGKRKEANPWVRILSTDERHG